MTIKNLLFLLVALQLAQARVDESALKTFLLDGYSRDVAPDYPISANLSFYVKSIEKMDIVHSMGKFNLI